MLTKSLALPNIIPGKALVTLLPTAETLHFTLNVENITQLRLHKNTDTTLKILNCGTDYTTNYLSVRHSPMKWSVFRNLVVQQFLLNHS